MSTLTIVEIAVSLALLVAMLVMIIRLHGVPGEPLVYSSWADVPVWLRALVISPVAIFKWWRILSRIGKQHWEWKRHPCFEAQGRLLRTDA